MTAHEPSRDVGGSRTDMAAIYAQNGVFTPNQAVIVVESPYRRMPRRPSRWTRIDDELAGRVEREERRMIQSIDAG